jgi:hypothetical protein
MAEITGEQQKVVGDRLGLATPVGNPTRGKGVSKIQEAHRGTLSVRNNPSCQAGKYLFGFPLEEWVASRANEQMAAPWEKAHASLPVPLQSPDGCGMKR